MKPFDIECIEPPVGPPEVVEVRISGFLDAHTVIPFESAMEDLLERRYIDLLSV